MTTETLPDGVSFLVTLYNKDAYIESALLGILRQDLPGEREIIICDDGSTDRSAEVASAVMQAHPQAQWVYFRTENSGPALATNRAAARARYRYLKPVDADDFLAPDATRRLAAALAARPDASLIVGQTVSASQAEWRQLVVRTDWPDAEPAAIAPYPASKLRRQMPFGPSGMLLPTAKFRACGGCDEDIFIQDYSLALNLSRVGTIYETSQPVCYAPEAVAGRLNGSPQLYHDLNLALRNHLDRVDLPTSEVARVTARCLGRAINFNRRHLGGGALIPARLSQLAAKLRLPMDHRRAIERSLALFGPVRRPRLDGGV